MIGSKQPDVTANKSDEIEKVVNALLEALNQDSAPTSQEEKERIISQYHQDDQDVVEIEINDWLAKQWTVGVIPQPLKKLSQLILRTFRSHDPYNIIPLQRSLYFMNFEKIVPRIN